MKANKVLFCSLLFLAALLVACGEEEKVALETDVQVLPQPKASGFEIQGHRGARGLAPENSIEGFILALELGVDVLEMDVVITEDEQVILSHEPWISAEICLDKEGEELPSDALAMVQHNIYQMSFKEVQEFDCGTKMHPRFPEQSKMSVHKPRLSALIDSVKAYCAAQGRGLPSFNIELKHKSMGEELYHPKAERYAELVLGVTVAKGIDQNCTYQSFSLPQLQALHNTHPSNLVLLSDENTPLHALVDELGFVPAVYSPNFNLLNESDMKYARAHQMKIIPWTVNELSDMEKLYNLGVDGIITDYPNKLIDLLEGVR
jgi:glycerophosphoryl diester phosphodiesterase